MIRLESSEGWPRGAANSRGPDHRRYPMIESKSSASRAPTSTREQRGLQLARERAGEIWPCGGASDVWRVPSGSAGSETIYLVDLDAESCSCEDHRRGGKLCKHVFAARVVRAKTAPC